MIGDWVAQSGMFLLAVAVIFTPGLLLGFAVRLRGLSLVATAPALTIGLLATLALAFPFVGIRWGLLSVAIAVAVVAVVLAGISALLGHSRWGGLRRRTSGVSWILLISGLMVGGGLNAARLMAVVGVPTAVSQTNDAVFHLNALRWIAESGSASSLDVSGLIGGTTFYPSAWHAVASLTAPDLALIPTAVNMVALVITAVVWPLSIAAFAWVVSGGRVVVASLAAALSAGLLAFPQLMFEWGVLYPYALSLAVLPAVAAAALSALRAWAGARGIERWRTSAGQGLVVVLGTAGVALAQPSSLLILGLIVLLWTSNRVLHRLGRWELRARVVGLGVLTSFWAALAGVWLALAYLAGPVIWRSYRSPLGAAGDVVLNSHAQLPAALLMSALLMVGLVLAVRRPSLRWFALAWTLVSVLYVVSVGTDLPIIKRALTGPWYGDSFRLAALVPLVVVPLAAVGLAWLIRRMTRVLQPDGEPWMVRGTATAMAIVAVLGAVGVAVAPVILLKVADETDAQSRYTMNEKSYLSTDEFDLMRRLPELVPEDALLLGNPSTGAGFAYLLGERDIVPRTWSPPIAQAWDVLAADLRDAGEDPAVCEALAAYGDPEYVLDFGPGEEGPGLYVMPGMTDFDGQTGFEEVAAEGDASLWRITACAD